MVPTKSISSSIRNGYVIKVNVHPGLLSKIWKREAKVFEFLVYIKQTKKGVYLGRILKDFFDLEGVNGILYP